ncbi:PAS domain S-box protein [uncultured Roseobacter sp.]|uniref:PAS domain S-box protein n=1 Tax=uncultured Roseobacter sp. TaxID=114847 RepID=UPI0026279B2A|nr:PAS domain S-box protein [uncultured Roseobacter sp.]
MNSKAQDSALLHAILEAAVDAMIISDDAGIIVRVNPAACRLFQYEASELIGQSVNILMPQALASLHDDFMAHYLDTGEKRIIGVGRDVEGQRKDKSVFPLHISVGSAEVEGKQRFIGILHDLTYRSATQDALARSQRLDAIGQMTGGIAHDFNNLLTVVIGNLELLEMRGANDRQASLIRDALESAQLGADLTERLMIFARRSNLKPIKADLRELCEDTLSILKRTLGATYRIKTDFAKELNAVMIDPVQLQSALMNLALNARDAMGAKGELLVSVANVTIDDTYMAQETDIQHGNYVRLSVSDDGAGMTVEAQKRAFEPFFTTKAASGGTGLGLAMVYGFVRQSGGHITLYSELGHGTSFGLYFPALSNTKTEKDGQEAAERDDALSPRGRGETVLVVEDNPKVRKLSVERIRDLGFETAEASNGDEAYRMLKNGMRADVLFSDLVMPGTLNGYDLAAKVNAEFPKLKVLLTSGYASDVVTDAMAHGRIYDILHKPYRQTDLAIRLQALLAGGSDG